MDKIKFVEIPMNSKPLDRETWHSLMTDKVLEQGGRLIQHEEWPVDGYNGMEQDEWLKMHIAGLEEGNKHREAYRDLCPFAIPRPLKPRPA